MIQCPLCAKAFPQEIVEVHASTCQGRQEDPEVQVLGEENQPEVVPEVISTENNNHHKRMRNGIDQEEVKILLSPSKVNEVSNKVQCPICQQLYSKSVIVEHAACCGDEVYV